MIKSANGANPVKFVGIAETLRQRIQNGVYTAKIPGERALSLEFNTTVITINKAVSLLIDRGFLHRQKGKGTFVRNSDHQVFPETGAIFIPQTTHTFNDFSNELRIGLQNAGYLPLVTDTSEASFRDNHQAIIESTIRMSPFAAIIFGLANFPFELLQKYEKQIPRLIFVVSCETELDFTAERILTDAWYGGYAATRHLLEQGHEHIVLLAHTSKVPAPVFRYSLDGQTIRGYQAALDESGLSNNCRIIHVTGNPGQDEKIIKDLFSGSNRPTAIFATADYFAVNAIQTLGEHGLSVPDDVAVAGYYDTPWCQKTPVPLTSVSIRTDLIAAAVIELLSGNATKGKNTSVKIKPELIVRKSSVKGEADE
jgi:DNA-binding LacI/PurR family transcriptional regulator